MNSAERRARMIFHAGNGVVALAVSACLLALLGFGIGGVPALGPALVPGHGAWRSAAKATLLTSAGLRSDSGGCDGECARSRPEEQLAQPAAVSAGAADAAASVLAEANALAEGIFPGGQSDDPASPWYSDLLGDWQTGTYLPMPAAGGTAAASSGAISWELRP